MSKLKKYTVVLGFHQTSRAEVTIKAKSTAHARRKADETEAGDVEDWNAIDGQVDVLSVEAK